MEAALVTGMFNIGFSATNTFSKDVGQDTGLGFKDILSKEMNNDKEILNKKDDVRNEKDDSIKKDINKNEELENKKTEDVKKTEDIKDKDVDKKTENKKDDEEDMTDKINGLVERVMTIAENTDVKNLEELKEMASSLMEVENIGLSNEEMLKLQEELKLRLEQSVYKVGPQSVETEKTTLNKYDELENELDALREKLGESNGKYKNQDVNNKVNEQNITEFNSELNAQAEGESEFSSSKDGEKDKKINISDFRKKETINTQDNQFDFNVEDIKLENNNISTENVSDVLLNNSVDMQEQIEVIKQISEKIDINLFEDKSEMIIKLKPDHLGKVTVEIALENGNITAKFLAESQKVKEILESNMQDLKDHLAKQGMVIQDLSVSVGDQDRKPLFEERNYKSFRRRQKIEEVNNDRYSVEGAYNTEDNNVINYWPDSTVSFSA